MTAAPAIAAPAIAVPRRSASPWLVAVAVVIPTFMEVLDTTIANVALRYIAGGLSAPVTDSEWVITSYLAANAIILPISGWLATRLGRRNYFLISIAVFTRRVGAVRHGHEPDHADRGPRAPGPGWRRAPALQPGRPARCLSPRKAGHGDDRVRHGGAARTRRRADARRLHHGQLRLALDLLPERPRRSPGAAHVQPPGGRPGLPGGAARRRPPPAPALRPARPGAAGGDDGLLGGDAEQGAGVGLARRSVPPRADPAGAVPRLPGDADRPGAPDRQSAHQLPHVE